MMKFLPILLIALLLCSACTENYEVLPEEKLDNPYIRVERLISTARNIYKDKPEEAEQMARQAIAIAEAEYYLRGVKEGHNVLYWLYLQEDNMEEKAAYHKKAYKKAARELEETQGLGALNYAKGHQLYVQGRYTEALSFLLESYDIIRDQNQPENAAYSLYTCALIFKKTGWPEKGIRYLNKIQLEKVPASFQVSVLKLKGMLHYDIGEYDNAIKNYSESLSIAQNTNDEIAALKIMNALALPLIDTKAYDETRQVIDESKALAISLDDKEKLGEVLQKEGLLYERLGAYTDAIEVNKDAGSYFRQTENGERLAMVHLDLSHLYKLTGEYDKALAAGVNGANIEGVSNETQRCRLPLIRTAY